MPQVAVVTPYFKESLGMLERCHKTHSDNGNTPRGMGTMLAESEGFPFIAFLDADNWYHPGHIQALLRVWQETGADICASARTIHDDEGVQLLGVSDADERAHTHADTSCLLIHKKAFESNRIWLRMPKQLSPVCDRVFFQYVRQRYRIAMTREKSVAFRTQYEVHYRAAGRQPPDGAKGDVGAEPFRWMRTLEGVQTTVQQLGFYPG